jgi:hydroxyacylglutathione hydrolase
MEKNKDLILHQMKVGLMENFVYLIGSRKTGEAAVVDPGWEADRILEQAKALNLKITHILLTHTHYDHTDSLAGLLSKTKAKVYVHKAEASNLKISSDKIVLTDHEQKIDIGGIPVRVLHTPGHSLGSQCFDVSGNLISGDTLFVQSCGRTDLPTGSEKQLFQSLALLAELPPETILLPGHDYGPTPTSTIAEEKRNNPFLKLRKK